MEAITDHLYESNTAGSAKAQLIKKIPTIIEKLLTKKDFKKDLVITLETVFQKIRYGL